ncbi:hypothetical protein D3C78_382330 [compost metagenome]
MTLTERAAEMVAELNRGRAAMHRVAQEEKTRATIAALIAKGRSAEQIIEALRRNPPVVDPQY